MSHNLTVNIAASFKNRSLSPQKYLLPKISGGVEKGEDVKTEPESTQWYTMKGQEAADKLKYRKCHLSIFCGVLFVCLKLFFFMMLFLIFELKVIEHWNRLP